MRVYTICHSQQSDQGLHYLQFSVWSGSTLFAILSRLINFKVYTVIFRNSVEQGLHYLPFSAFWSVYTFYHSQQSGQVQGQLLFSATIWTGSTLFVILSSLIMVYTICHSQQSDQSLHFLPYSAVWSYFISSIMNFYTVCCYQQSDEGLYYLSFSAVWSGSTLLESRSSLIKVKVHCHPQEQGLHYLPFSAVWPTLFAILSRHYLSFFLRSSTLFFHSFLAFLWRSTMIAIFDCLVNVYTICHSQQSDQGLHCFPF